MPISTNYGQDNGSLDPGAMNKQPLPPLPDLKTKPGGNSQTQGGATDPFEQTLRSIKPVSDAVNNINKEIANIARSGAIPMGGGGPLEQIVTLVNSLLPLAAQNMIRPDQFAASMPPPSVPPSPGGVTPGGPGGPIAPVSPGPPQ